MKIAIMIELEVSGYVTRAEPSNGHQGDVKDFKVMKGSVDITDQLTREELSELCDAFFSEKCLQRDAEMAG